MILNRPLTGYSDTPYTPTEPFGPITPAQYIEEQGAMQASTTSDLMAKANEISAKLSANLAAKTGLRVPTWAVLTALSALALGGGVWAYRKFSRRSRRSRR